jgi:hypothetical protein
VELNMHQVVSGIMLPLTCQALINPMFVAQDQRRMQRTNRKALHNPETSFSDPIDVDTSDAESFDEDDMYGSDHGMETVSESSDDENEVEVSETSLEIVVCVWPFPNPVGPSDIGVG